MYLIRVFWNNTAQLNKTKKFKYKKWSKSKETSSQPLEHTKIQNLKMKETIKGISTIYLQTRAHSYLKLFMQNNVTLYFYRKYHEATRLTKILQQQQQKRIKVI